MKKDENENEKKLQKFEEEVGKQEEINRFEPVKLDELLYMDFPESKWVIEKLIPYQGITVISGAPASFKTWILLKMALDIAKGESLLGQFKCEKYNVLIIDEENHLRLVQERLKLLGADSNLPIYFLSQKGFLVSKKELLKKVLKICEQKEIDIIFIDSLVRVNNAEENDASQMAEVFRCIKTFCKNDKTVILTHHERKEGTYKSSAQNRLRGSSDISAAVDAHLSLKRDKDDKSKILVEQAKIRSDEEIEPFEITMKKNNGKMEVIYLGPHSEEANKKDLAKETIQLVLKEEREGLSRKKICQKVNEIESIGSKSIRNAINELLNEHIISEEKGPGNTRICFLAETMKKKQQKEVLI